MIQSECIQKSILSSRQDPPEPEGRSLFSRYPPVFTAVPHYLDHGAVDLLSLTEPDKRLSQTSGSSGRPSVSLRPTTRIQIFADPRGRPFYPGQGLSECVPGVCLALALAVEPGQQNTFRAINIVAAPFRVIRDGVIIQVADHSGAGLPEQLTLSQDAPRFPYPLRERAQALCQLRSTGTAFDLEVTLTGLAAVMRQPQEGKLGGFLAARVRARAGIAPNL